MEADNCSSRVYDIVHNEKTYSDQGSFPLTTSWLCKIMYRKCVPNQCFSGTTTQKKSLRTLQALSCQATCLRF